MGCDIHMFIEKKLATDGGYHKWHNIDNWQYDEYCVDDRKLDINPAYDNRNYRLFATLAGVRDYCDDTEMIDAPRGFPSDASAPVLDEYKLWDCDAHTPSWFTFRELKEFAEAHNTTTHGGLISQDDANLLDDGGVLDDLMPALIERFKDTFWLFGDRYETGNYESELEDRVRIVFWFDN